MPKRKVTASLRRYFVTGLLSLLPTVVVAYLVLFLFHKFADATRWVVGLFPGDVPDWAGPLLSLLFLILGFSLIIIIGVVSTTLVGRAAARFWYRVIFRIPILSRIYVAVEQVGSALSFRNRVFKGVVLIEYPRSGMYRIAFITSDGVSDLGKEGMLALFVPTTPNPLTGYLFLASPEVVTPVDMAVEEAIKMVISGGFVTPSDGQTVAAEKDVAPLLWRANRDRNGGGPSP